jgi:hypothetical protein
VHEPPTDPVTGDPFTHELDRESNEIVAFARNRGPVSVVEIGSLRCRGSQLFAEPLGGRDGELAHEVAADIGGRLAVDRDPVVEQRDG